MAHMWKFVIIYTHKCMYIGSEKSRENLRNRINNDIL